MKKIWLGLVLIILLGGVISVIWFSYSDQRYLSSVAEYEKGSFLREDTAGSLFDMSVASASASVTKKNRNPQTPGTTTQTPTTTSGVFSEPFSINKTIEETGSQSESSSGYWWVNSGGRLIVSAGTGKTIQGDLSSSDRWYTEYARTNPADTDKGLHPQNIFRLVERGSWNNFTQQAYFKINKINLSASSNRNASNGLFLFNRYQSGDNLYYTGIRVDGGAVIKKKINGQYYTMAYKAIFSGAKYDRDANPNLLPLSTWIGIRSDVQTNVDGSVSIKMYVDKNKTGTWTLVLETVDKGSTFGSVPILGAGFAGIRTDFLDGEFDDYSITQL